MNISRKFGSALKRTRRALFPFESLLEFNGIQKDFPARFGCSLSRRGDTILINKGRRRIIISIRNVIYLYDLLPYFDLYFSQVIPSVTRQWDVVDFSRQRVHTLTDCGIPFEFSSLAEGAIAFSSYIYGERPREGAVVLDAGAYCGVSTYFFSRLVGPAGKVVALEPDAMSFQSLERNIAAHGLKNVIAIQAALCGSSGVIDFNSEGALGSSLSNLQSRPDSSSRITVPTFNLSDLLKHLSLNKFDYVKMDIEGAEIDALEGYS